MTDKILIEVPDHIYYTGNVTVRYQRPDGEWYESTFFPGQYEEEIAKARATKLAKVLSEVEEMITEVESVNESNGRYNACQELRAKLNQLKGRDGH